MQHSLRQQRLREQRTAFFLFCGMAVLYLIVGLPLVAGALAR
jgi:hypothetical protein